MVTGGNSINKRARLHMSSSCPQRMLQACSPPGSTPAKPLSAHICNLCKAQQQAGMTQDDQKMMFCNYWLGDVHCETRVWLLVLPQSAGRRWFCQSHCWPDNKQLPLQHFAGVQVHMLCPAGPRELTATAATTHAADSCNMCVAALDQSTSAVCV